ncbi:hypothetical protein DYB32_001270 [Aphanomyces invadans]|uniref:Uncharacterized protein n=1 Tax=Aphanomyces invadans TaxID=157072 RepID=A0A3R6W2Y7_9STRA|nr:hypothetical protein DYB32_001270 [Aphanomyces invadans]
MKFVSAAVLLVVCAVAAAVPSTPNTTVVAKTSCFDQPTIVFPNGSNSTYECWVNQFQGFDTDSPDSFLSDCNARNNGYCFFIGNDRVTAPSLGYDYYVTSLNQHTATVRQSSSDAVWRRVEMAYGTMGLYFNADGTCLDAYWQGGVLKVHQWVCEFGNANQWWRYAMHNDIQLFEHGTHVGWCLQTNGYGYNVEMVRCNWDIVEQQRRLYW